MQEKYTAHGTDWWIAGDIDRGDERQLGSLASAAGPRGYMRYDDGGHSSSPTRSRADDSDGFMEFRYTSELTKSIIVRFGLWIHQHKLDVSLMLAQTCQLMTY